MEAKEQHNTELHILSDIKEAEKRAETILEKAREDKESIIHDAIIAASTNFAKKSEEIRKSNEKKIADSRENAKELRESKIKEAKARAKSLKTKASKNSSKAVEYILKKFEEMVND